MSKLRSSAFIALSIVLCSYIGVWAYFANERPAQLSAPYESCIDNCRVSMEYLLSDSENYQYALMHDALNQIFLPYAEEEVGYYISCNSNRCALWVYVNTPSKLPPILRRLENEVSPFFYNESPLFQERDGKAIYSNYSIYPQLYQQSFGIYHAIHHRAVPA